MPSALAERSLTVEAPVPGRSQRARVEYEHVSTALAPRTRSSSASHAVRAAARSRFAPAALGVVGGAVAYAGAGTPSYWGDEAASIVSAQRSLPSLFAELGHIDAVHGLYYLF